MSDQREDGVEPIITPEDARTAETSGSSDGLFADTVMALRFFSRLPSGDRPHEAPSLGRMAPALPFASLLIGIGPALILSLLAWAGMPPLVCATLAVIASMLVTGAMSADALADSADGLFGGHEQKRRLEIMKDSRHGTYGVSALCLYVVGLVAALGAMADVNPLAAGGVWLAAGIASRSVALWLPFRLPAARAGGVGAAAGRPALTPFCIGVGFAAALAFILAGPFTSLAALILTALLLGLLTSGWTVLCERLVGGQTGDLSGALMGLCELLALAVLASFV
ncbi:adenosylcobinamide-GDP ribazoletransferase [Devosia pacifica]|uniref:adenosylcobinamide-GDP ribazoletransferase n=1 Tax=Devosia pacifica TaxID=1335967 RepID=UPI001671AA9D|nr:adenosylcobinamide-GDP ribazoletransferase [Devosia pacifica]